MAHPHVMYYIGIDPGASGGISILSADQSARVESYPSEKLTDYDIFQILRGTASYPCVAALERVWSSPGWGHVGAFKFGLSYGSLRMALTAAAIPFDEVLPKDWQRTLGVSYPKDGKPRDKNITKRRAQSLFPGHHITHAIADSLLIAEYCRRMKGPRYESHEEEGRQSQDRQPRQDRTRHAESVWQDEWAPQNRLATIKVARPPTRAPRH